MSLPFNGSDKLSRQIQHSYSSASSNSTTDSTTSSTTAPSASATSSTTQSTSVQLSSASASSNPITSLPYTSSNNNNSVQPVTVIDSEEDEDDEDEDYEDDEEEYSDEEDPVPNNTFIFTAPAPSLFPRLRRHDSIVSNPHRLLNLQIASRPYTIDFQSMIQYDSQHPDRKRNIQRTLVAEVLEEFKKGKNAGTKGQAGVNFIRTESVI